VKMKECPDCGELYGIDPGTPPEDEIVTCRDCGGVLVEARVEQS